MSIRTVQTSFTSQPSWSSPSPSTSVLRTVNMNQPTAYVQSNRKFPPGLGYVAPSPPQHVERVGRRRSGTFSYNSGNTYASGNVSSGPQATQGPRGRRPATTASSRLSYIASDPFRVTAYCTTPATPIKFDPFASDDDLSSPAPIYNHYWQYNPTTNSPEMVYEKPSTPVKSSPSSNSLPYTIKLPSVSSPSLPTTVTSSLPPTTRRSTALRNIQSSTPPPKPDRNVRAKLVAGILLNRIYAVGKPMRRRFSMVQGKAYVKSNLSSVVSVEC